MMHLILFFVTFLAVEGGGEEEDSSSISSRTSTIESQVFCDNFCKVYLNGVLYHDDTGDGSGRNVANFDMGAKKGDTRTIAVWLADNPYGENNGVWQFGNSNYLKDGTLSNLWCLGDGGFKGVFYDDECDDTIITDGNWKCQSVRTGPLDVDECFNDGFYTHPTFAPKIIRLAGQDGNPNDYDLELNDPCIENDGTVELLDTCSEFIESNYDQNWVVTGYNDSSWDGATVYTEEDALPKGGRPSTADVADDCSDTLWYCAFEEDSWSNAEFIWSQDIELDNVVLCRYEYEPSCRRRGRD